MTEVSYVSIQTGYLLVAACVMLWIIVVIAYYYWNRGQKQMREKLLGKPMSWDNLSKGVFYSIISIGTEKESGEKILTVQFIAPSQNKSKPQGWQTVSVRVLNSNLLTDNGLTAGRSFSIANDGTIIKEDFSPMTST